MKTPTNPARLRRLAEERRQQAAHIARTVRRSELGPGPAYARERADELYRLADDLEALAEITPGGSYEHA